MVQVNTTVPAVKPDNVAALDVESEIIACPEFNVQIPVPDDGIFASSVTVSPSHTS